MDATIRARGFVTGGDCNRSGWFVETLITNRVYLRASLGRAVGAAGGGGCVQVTLESSVNLTNLTFAMVVPPDRFTNFTVTALAPEVGGATISSPGTTRVVVNLAATPGQVLRGPKQFAEVCFDLLPEQSSAFVSMEVENVVGLRDTGAPVGKTTGHPGGVVVVNERPLLECVHGPGGQPNVLLYARPGWVCSLEEHLGIEPGIPWQEIQRLTATQLASTLPLWATNQQVFYRAVLLAP